MEPKCVIFDCDGVLVDSVDLSIRTLIEMAWDQGLQLDYNFAFNQFGGSSLHSSLKYIEEKIGKPLPDSFEKQFRERTYEVFKNELRPISGIQRALEQITIPFCVASNGPMEKIKLNLTLTGLMDYFEGKIFSSYEINSWKPDPAIFLYAAKKMGFTPGNCLVIEDSADGVQAAISGEFQVFGYDPYPEINRLNSLDIPLFQSMDRLPSMISKLA